MRLKILLDSMILARALYGKRDYLQASAHLEAALKQKPGDGESAQLLRLSYFQLGYLRQAINLREDATGPGGAAGSGTNGPLHESRHRLNLVMITAR